MPPARCTASGRPQVGPCPRTSAPEIPARGDTKTCQRRPTANEKTKRRPTLSRKKVQKFHPGSVLMPSIVLLSSSRCATRSSNAVMIPSLSLAVRSVQRAGSSGAGYVGREICTHLSQGKKQMRPQRQREARHVVDVLANAPISLAEVEVAPDLVQNATSTKKPTRTSRSRSSSETCRRIGLDDVDDDPFLALAVGDERVPGLELVARRRLVRLVVLREQREKEISSMNTSASSRVYVRRRRQSRC